MNLSKDKLVDTAEKYLNSYIKKDAVIYLFADRPAPDIIKQTKLKGQIIPNGANLLFIDLLPGANWAHPSVYLWTDQFGNFLNKFAGEFPPYNNHLKVLKKLGTVEDWKLLSTEYVQ